jgi:predicted PurR-regulated permease PerM
VLNQSGGGSNSSAGAARWARLRDSGVAILAWLGIIFVFFWLIGHIIRALLLVAIAALLAYALSPVVDWLGRRLPRWLAVTIVYVAALAVLGGLGFLIVSTAAAQLSSLSHAIPQVLRGGGPSFISDFLNRFGVSAAQLNDARQQLISQAEGAVGAAATQVLPIVTGVANFLLDALLTLVISVYLVIDGPRVIAWLRTAAPATQRNRVLFFLATLQRTGGGYIRGQMFMSTFIGVLVGIGMMLFGVPYALLLGVLAFILEFIPIIGTIVSGVVCLLIALPTRGLVLTIGVLVYFALVHVLEGDVVGPRVIGRVLGLHPVVAIVALVVGADLFGIVGALFAGPVAGIIQAVVVAAWSEWRIAHSDQFPEAPPQAAEHAAEPAGEQTQQAVTPTSGKRP